MSRMIFSSSSCMRKVGRSCFARQFSGTEELAKTAFYDLHEELGGKMVSFAGYSLPVQVIQVKPAYNQPKV